MISLIIPAFNEQEIIENTVQRAISFLNEAGGYELIVVNDGSCDNTAEILHNTNAFVVSLPYNKGKGAAVKEGIAWAKGDYIFFTDCDLPYSLDFIKSAIPILKDFDVVCGRRTGSYPPLRRFASALYNSLARNALGIDIEDIQCGIKGFRAAAAKSIFTLCKVNGFAFDTEVLFLADKMGMSINSLAVEINHRADSRVHMLSDGLIMAGEILKIRKCFESGEYGLQSVCKR